MCFSGRSGHASPRVAAGAGAAGAGATSGAGAVGPNWVPELCLGSNENRGQEGRIAEETRQR